MNVTEFHSCVCPNCDAKILLPKRKLLKLEKPFIRCKACLEYLRIKPVRARCFYCNYEFSYYSHLLTHALSVVECKNCSNLNKLRIPT